MSYEIMIRGVGPGGTGRSFIVAKEDVIKGGIPRTYPAGPTIRHEVELQAGPKIYTITNACGKILEKYPDVMVIRIDGQEVVHDEKKEITVEEKIARLTAQIEDLKAKKSKPKKAKAKKEIKEP